MRLADTIKRQLERTGRSICFEDGDWTSMPFKACISHLWRKRTSNFEPVYTELGKSFPEYYLYIGPYNHDITSLSESAYVLVNHCRYEIRCADAVFFNDEIIYYTGVLKKSGGTDDEA